MLARAGAAAMGGARRHRSAPGFTSEGLVVDWWVEPGAVTLNDASGTERIAALVDSGPNGYDLAQATDGQRPSYDPAGVGGQPGGMFGVSRGDVLRLATGPSVAAGPLTIYAWLTASIAVSGTRYLVSSEGGLGIVPLSSTAGVGLAVIDGTATTRSFGVAAAGDQSLVFTLADGVGTASAHRNGALVGTADYSATALSGAIAMGGIHTGANTNTIAASVARVRIYTGAHDAEVRAQNLAAGAAIYGFGVP